MRDRGRLFPAFLEGWSKDERNGSTGWGIYFVSLHYAEKGSRGCQGTSALVQQSCAAACAPELALGMELGPGSCLVSTDPALSRAAPAPRRVRTYHPGLGSSRYVSEPEVSAPRGVPSGKRALGTPANVWIVSRSYCTGRGVSLGIGYAGSWQGVAIPTWL